MSARWTQLELALAAQVRTEPAFKSVQTAASTGVTNISPNGYPASVLQVVSAKTIGKRAVMGSLYLMKRIFFNNLIATKIPDTVPGSSRFTTGGVWELYDLSDAKLVGFSPVIDGPTINAIFPVYEEELWIDRLEPGACDLVVLYSIDVEIQNPITP